MTSTQQYVLISIKEEALFKAIGVYQNEQDAYAAATVCQMQSIEKRSAKWPKSMLADKQERIMELCRCIKEDFKSYKERFAYVTLQCSQIFPNLEYDQHRVLPIEANSNMPSQSISESVFKTKVRNFMDVLRTRSDVEEDLGNSEDDDEDEDDEEEEDEEEGEEEEEDEGNGENDGEQDIEEEEDIEEEDIDQDVDEEADEDEDIQEEDDEDEPATSETVIHEHSEEEESEDQERPTLKRDASSLLEEGDAEDDEEDEIDEDDGDEDELADDDDESVKRRRVAA
ncbi:hypothetical protein V8B55DRAFT_1507069 [Mucor lusitanicus]|uniref:Uncharacterized protein n=1 Tax=Mucor circinelloides f. lusitanicus TaxID=29924 RepID=A0A8H4BJS5_MUCCL|nr:hypothetical protein FB192DRAFT_1081343 [Mucor lusitanicus]